MSTRREIEPQAPYRGANGIPHLSLAENLAAGDVGHLVRAAEVQLAQECLADELKRLTEPGAHGARCTAMISSDSEEWVTTVFQLHERLRLQMPTVLLDVRESDEFALCHIEGAKLIPLLDVPAHIGDFNPAEEIVVCCHTGNRSLEVVKFLRRRGFQHVSNLEGGIDLWAIAIDRSFPIYGRDPEKTNALKQAFWERAEKFEAGPTA